MIFPPRFNGIMHPKELLPRVLFNTLSLIIILFLFCPSLIIKPEAKELLIPIFDLNNMQEDNVADQIENLEKSIYLDVKQLIEHLCDPFPQSGNQINFYLRNEASSDLILTDMVTNLDRKLIPKHYNFSVENPEILYQNTIQKITISDIPSGEHLYHLKFLLHELPAIRKKEKPNPSPIKSCLRLSDAYCLHQKPIIDNRIIKECSFHFSLQKDQTLSIIISFNDGSIPQMQALPSKAREKLKVDLEIAKCFYRNQKYLKCLWIVKTIEEDFFHFPELDKVLFLKAECYFQLQMYTEAVYIYQQFAKKFPQSSFIQLSMLRQEMIHYLLQKYDEAIAYFNQFGRYLTKETILEPARFIAAKSYYHKNNLVSAKQLLKYIPQESPYYPEALYLHTLCCLEKKQYSAAASALKKITKIVSSPPSYPLMKEMRHILAHGTNRDNLIQESYLQLAKIFYQQKQNKKALKELEIISPEAPFYPSALLLKGLIFIRLDYRKEIKKIIDELSQIKLENQFLADARFYLAHKLQQSGNYTQAVAYYEESLHRCREGLSAIELLQNDPGQIERLLHFILKNNPTELPPLPTLLLLYPEIPNYPKLKASLWKWSHLMGMEKILHSMEGLILEPVNNYQKRIQLLIQLRKKSNIPSPLNQNVSQIKLVYRQIEAQKEKIRKIENSIFSQIKKEVYESIDQVDNRLTEIRERANLEVMLITFQKNFSASSENRSAKLITDLQKVIAAHELFLEKYPQRSYREKILFQLAECYYQKSIIEFQLKLKEAEVRQKPTNLLVETKPNFDQAIKIYNKILFEFPCGNYREKTLYALAYAYQEQGVIILANVIFQLLVSDFPKSSLLPEVFLRLGEIFFSENKFAEAAKYYERSMKFSELPEQYRNNIFYRLGWSYYQQNHYEKAFQIFTSLTDQYLQAGKLTLADEMIYQLAKIFSEYDSMEDVKNLISLLKDKSYHFRILQEYAALLFDQGRIEEAVSANQWIIDQYPLHPLSPILQSKIEKCYLDLNNPKAANSAREKLITTYGENTVWWKKNKGKEVREKVSSLIDTSIRNSAVYLLEAKNKKEYQESITFYRENLKFLPSGEQVYTINFFLAECLFKTDQYREALDKYEQILQNKKFNQFTEDAAYKQILCLEKIINQKSSKTGVPVEPPSKEWDTEEKKFIAACKYIFRTFPNHKNLPEVLYKKGELHFQKNEYTEAMKSFDYIVKDFPDNKIRPAAMKMIAKIHFNQQQFDPAANVYSQLVDEYDQIIKTAENKDLARARSARRKAHEMIALSKYQAAESLKTKSPLKAAERFELAADTFPKIKIADEALFEAAYIYQTNGQDKKAQDIFSRILKQYPQSKYAPQSLAQIALYHEKNKQLLMAAQNFEKLYLDYPKYSDSAKALYKAGVLYEQLENWDKVHKIFSIYQAKFHPKPALAIECIFRRGYALMKSGDAVKADAAFHGVVETYKRYKKLDDTLMAFYAARAQFLISERIFEAYNNLKIQEVSERGRQPKLNLLKKVIKNYRDTADFTIAEWTTAAVFKMGLAMDIFAQELWERSSARRKSGDESAYVSHIQLQQKIIEFFEKAVLFHQKNLFLAKENDIHDQWITRSQENISEDYWKMGQLNEKIYTLLKDAPIPEILDETEERQYRKALLSKALPYQKQAVELYAKNTTAFINGIAFNSFIAQSYKRLALLNPKKYLRDEVKMRAEDQSSLSYPESLLIQEY